jgi:CheY-like chemotaxis protein/anti-sigma regulatory factor (Ser/Thr protein kinase)
MHKDATILIVDDEINNIRLLQADLEDDGYERFLIARDGVEAWDILQEKHHEINAVLLDRMMPNMDGMQVLKNVKAHHDIRHIPIIMQTAAASKEQMLEGIAAGVYYYLTKPYDEETLLAIVSAALRDYASYKRMRKDINQFKRKIHLIKDSNFRIKTLDDATYLGTFLAGFFPDPERSVLGLSELLINAIEHGNLGITYEEKSELLDEDRWHDEVERRLQLPEHKDKYVEIFYCREETEIFLSIKDQGAGFNWQEYLDIDPIRATHSHGRGIAMARMMSFDEMQYQGNGNEVHCRVRLETA